MQVDWELSKENFQPLKRGRKEVSKPVGLSEGKAEIESQRRQASEHSSENVGTCAICCGCLHRQFWQELELYDGGDPLEVWTRYATETRALHKTAVYTAGKMSQLIAAGSLNGRRRHFEVVVIKQSCCPFLSVVPESSRDMSNISPIFDTCDFGSSM